MPRAGETKKPPPHVIEKTIKRHLEGGEPVAKLAKDLKVTRQTIYSWVGAVPQGSCGEGCASGQIEGGTGEGIQMELVAKLNATEGVAPLADVLHR